MREDDLKLIRELPLFSEMSSQRFAMLMKAALFQRFPEQVTLIEEGHRPDFLHVVVEGTVELFARHRERETTIDIIEPVTTFILAAIARDEPYLKSARTLASSRILLIPAQAVRHMIGRDPAFAKAMINELALRYRDVVRLLKNEKLRTGSEKLANWILRASDQSGHGQVELNFEKRTLAARLGMSPENLSRSLSHLARHGVRCQGRKIEILDRMALESFAAPDQLMDG